MNRRRSLGHQLHLMGTSAGLLTSPYLQHELLSRIQLAGLASKAPEQCLLFHAAVKEGMGMRNMVHSVCLQLNNLCAMSICRLLEVPPTCAVLPTWAGSAAGGTVALQTAVLLRCCRQ